MPKSSPSKETATDSKTAISAASRPRPLPKTDDLPTCRGSTFNRRKGVKIRPSLTALGAVNCGFLSQSYTQLSQFSGAKYGFAFTAGRFIGLGLAAQLARV